MKAKTSAEKFSCNAFKSSKELVEDGNMAGVIIATPHYLHASPSTEAFTKGILVLTEKPVGVHVRDIEKIIEAHEQTKKRSLINFFSHVSTKNQRGSCKDHGFTQYRRIRVVHKGYLDYYRLVQNTNLL